MTATTGYRCEEAPGLVPLRDSSGRWWLWNRDGWYCYQEDGGWLPARIPPHWLEGPSFEEREAEGPPWREDLSACEAVQWAVHAIAEGYWRGALDSENAYERLTWHYLVDTLGRAWTVGFHSREWYWFQDGDWLRSAHAPDLRSLVPPDPATGALELEDDAAERFSQFLAEGSGTLPEPVCPSWEPPAWS